MSIKGLPSILPATVAIEIGEALIDAGTDALIYDVPSGVIILNDTAVSLRIDTDVHPPDDDMVIIVVP